MKRTILALAIAGLSVAAYALPPPGGGPPTPTANVIVANPDSSPAYAQLVTHSILYSNSVYVTGYSKEMLLVNNDTDRPMFLTTVAFESVHLQCADDEVPTAVTMSTNLIGGIISVTAPSLAFEAIPIQGGMCQFSAKLPTVLVLGPGEELHATIWAKSNVSTDFSVTGVASGFQYGN